MKNTDTWRATKFVYYRNRLRGSRNRNDVAISSRLNADLVAHFFDQYLKEHTKGRLVDLGCGKVPLYASYRDSASEITCVDWNLPDQQNHLDIQADLNDPLPFSSGAFDTVVLSDVLEHIAKPWQLFAEMGRILAPSGKLFVSVPFYYQLHEVPHDYYRYTEFALRRFAADNSFTVLVLKPTGGAPEVLADLIAKNVLRLPLLGGLLSRLVQASTAFMLRFSFAKKISNKTAEKFPLGYFMIAEKTGDNPKSS